MQHFAAFGGEEEVIERRPSAGWREASAEPKLTEKEERIKLTKKEETEFLRN
jgi:hypothetical protein